MTTMVYGHFAMKVVSCNPTRSDEYNDDLLAHLVLSKSVDELENIAENHHRTTFIVMLWIYSVTL
jgi:hypothetical protein